MNSYTVAFGILGLGVFLAALMWSVPLVKRNRQVRRFRQALVDIDTVARSWSHALREDRARPNEGTFPEAPRHRHDRRGHPDDGGAALV